MTAASFSGPPDPWVQRLQDELTRVRQCLAEMEAPTDDDEDALEALDALRDEVAQDLAPDRRGLRQLRIRVKALIGILLPVAEIIGGVAALQEICGHL